MKTYKQFLITINRRPRIGDKTRSTGSPHITRRKFSITLFFLLLFSVYFTTATSQPIAEVYSYLKGLSNGKYLFGQMATWVHDENPDMDHESNWLHKVYEHTGVMPAYATITYDFNDDPFSDMEWNQGVKEMWDRGLLVGVYSFYANPAGGNWNDPIDIDLIFAKGNNPTKTNFYQQMDRMATNMKWLEERGVPVIYTPFVESDDGNKWHAKNGSANAIRLYRLVHDYFNNEKNVHNIIWAFHTRQVENALQNYYPGDSYVDIIGKSGYGTGLIFNEYEWAVEKKKKAGKLIWWAELGIRGRDDDPRDCLDVVEKLENSFPELFGFSFWSDSPFYNVVGNLNGEELIKDPRMVTRDDLEN